MFSDQKRSSGLMVIGLFILLVAGCTARTHMTENGPGKTLEFKAADEPIALNSLVQGQVANVRFFEGERSKRAFMADRNYDTRFARTMTRTIYTEITLDHTQPKTTIRFPITLYFRQNGKTLRIEEFETRIKPDWSSSSHVISAGNFEPGKWSVGNYDVDVFINAKKAATGYFEIY